jgi:hypothetical protein
MALRVVASGIALLLLTTSPAGAALAFRFDRASARPGQSVLAFEPGWNGVPGGLTLYLVPTRLPGVTPDAAGSYILKGPPAHGAIRLGGPYLTASHRIAIRFRVPRARPGDYTIAFWCLSCSKDGDFFASALWGARWTGAPGSVLRITR